MCAGSIFDIVYQSKPRPADCRRGWRSDLPRKPGVAEGGDYAKYNSLEFRVPESDPPPPGWTIVGRPPLGMGSTRLREARFGGRRKVDQNRGTIAARAATWGRPYSAAPRLRVTP